MGFELVCVECSAWHDASNYRISCERCGNLLDVEYDTPKSVDARVVPGAKGLARYSPMLPIRDPANLVTMGEGDTPIVPLSNVGRSLGLRNLYGKLEYQNPTGSFKDRGNAVQVTVLKEAGITEIADSTTGNAGNSTAAYCARAGIRYIGFAEEGVRDRKTEAMALHGTELHWVKGDRQARKKAVRKFCEDTGILFFDYGSNAYFNQGQKTIAYEIAEQMATPPDHIIAATGNGSVLLGLWKGFGEMLEDGRGQRMPRLHAAQTELFQPLVAAYNEGGWNRPPDDTRSVAVGIRIAEPPRLQTVVKAMRETGGQPVAVPEEAIISWQRRLAQGEGIFIEPTTATALAGLEALVAQRVIGRNDVVLLPLTGAGIKEPIPELP